VTNKERVELYLSPEAKEAFEKAVVEHFGQLNGFKSQAGEMALREWADRDRDARIEDKLDRVLDELAPGPSEESLERERNSSNNDSNADETWPTGRVGSSLTAIEDALPSTGTVSDEEIETAIEEHGGSAYKTVQKYWGLVEKHNLAFEVPGLSDTYAVDPGGLAMACETSDEVSAADVRNVVDEYVDDFGADLQYPEEWYLHALEETYAEHNDLKFAQAPDLDDTEWREETFGEVTGETEVQPDDEKPGTEETPAEGIQAGEVADEMDALQDAVTDGGNTAGDE